MKTSALDTVMYLLLVVGGLNWGLVGLFSYNLVDSIFGVESALSRIIYVIVGVSAVYVAVRLMSPKATEAA
jgi:uncharacterized protein